MFTLSGYLLVTVETSDAEYGDNLWNRSSLPSIQTDGMLKTILRVHNSRKVCRFLKFSSFILSHGHRTFAFALRTP
jgi:hypothetical protein